MTTYNTWDEYYEDKNLDYHMDSDNIADYDIVNYACGKYSISGETRQGTFVVEELDDDGILINLIGIYTDTCLDDLCEELSD